jgi:hypothetical protein
VGRREEGVGGRESGWEGRDKGDGPKKETKKIKNKNQERESRMTAGAMSSRAGREAEGNAERRQSQWARCPSIIMGGD